MAIKLPDGRIMRTLPEQVDKNMQDIASINNEVNVIKESITTAYKIQGSATVADLNANTPDAAMNGYVYNMTDAGFLINSDESTTSVQIGDNVVLVWNDGNYFWDRLSGVVDTSNLVTLDSEQEITAKKIFNSGLMIGSSSDWEISKASSGAMQYINTGNARFVFGYSVIRPGQNNNIDLGSSSYTWKDLYLGGYAYFNNSSENRTYYQTNGTTQWLIKVGSNGNLTLNRGGSYDRFTFRTSDFIPNVNNTIDLGATGLYWKNLYIAGNLTDGTNSVKVAEIIKKRLTVSYNVSAAASSGISLINLTLSADDLAKLDSTKPLIVANNSTSAAVISAVYLQSLNLFTVLAYQTQGNTSLDFDIYQ